MKIPPFSLLDTDLYKLTMQQAVIEKFPNEIVKYSFINRGGTIFPKGFDSALIDLIKEYCSKAVLLVHERNFLKETCPFLTPIYLDFLSGFHMSSEEVKITQPDGILNVEVTGYWYRTILWEVPLLSMISELYYQMMGKKIVDCNSRRNNNVQKGNFFAENGICYADFGTRRRFSYENQLQVISDLIESSGEYFTGTSNVHFAEMFDITPLGTQAHEWHMFHGVKYGYRISNELALKNWADIYQGSLGIALSDTFTTDVFLRSFNSLYAKLFDGTRQDSGDPILYLQKIVEHYIYLDINPMSKIVLFSDSLNCDRVLKIRTAVISMGKGIVDRYGIGTFLTNDLVGIDPLNIVMKLTAVKEKGVGFVSTVKLSDIEGKYTGDKKSIEVCKQELGL